MPVLTDTNVFLRLLQPHHPHCVKALRALDFLRARGESLQTTTQNLVELWAASTRPPDENGLGFTAEQAAVEIERIQRLWIVLPEVPVFEEWRRIVRTFRVSGRGTHDARLVAAMRVHGIDRILTFNGRDFARYSGIEVLDPFSLG